MMDDQVKQKWRENGKTKKKWKDEGEGKWGEKGNKKNWQKGMVSGEEGKEKNRQKGMGSGEEGGDWLECFITCQSNLFTGRAVMRTDSEYWPFHAFVKVRPNADQILLN